MGKAIENYLGQYDNYYPAKSCYGWNDASRMDGVYKKISGAAPERVWDMRNTDNVSEMHDMRLIGMGLYTGTLDSSNTDLKAAPFGLGLLLETGTLPDAKVYYCPSAKDTTIDVNSAKPHDQIRDWASAGGFGKDTLATGTWLKKSSSNIISVLSQYHYRCQPGVNRGGATKVRAMYSIAYTKPKLGCIPGTAIFKTPKALKGRALVCDSFGKVYVTTTPGFGDKAHKDGYNVLFGDYNTRWYSDVEKRIIYWEMPIEFGADAGSHLFNNGHYFAGQYWDTSWNGGAGGWLTGNTDGNSRGPARATLGVPLVWHTLDEWIGIDVNVAAEDGVDTLSKQFKP